MRILAAALVIASTWIVSAAVAAPARSAMEAALLAGDWRRAAQLGASAADVVRAAQAKGAFGDMTPAESVVTIGPDNSLSVVALRPLPPLDAAAHPANLRGSGFAFGAGAGSIVLYPPYAQASFAPERPAPADGSHP